MTSFLVGLIESAPIHGDAPITLHNRHFQGPIGTPVTLVVSGLEIPGRVVRVKAGKNGTKNVTVKPIK